MKLYFCHYLIQVLGLILIKLIGIYFFGTRFNANDFIDESEKILIVQGTEDELVDFNIVKEFAENNIIDFKPVEGADHRFNSPADLRKFIDYVEELYKENIK